MYQTRIHHGKSWASCPAMPIPVRIPLLSLVTRLYPISPSSNAQLSEKFFSRSGLCIYLTSQIL